MEFLNELLAKDKTYQKDLESAKYLEKQYEELPIDLKHRMIIEDYIACLCTVQSRKCSLAYIAGTLSDEDKYL